MTSVEILDISLTTEIDANSTALLGLRAVGLVMERESLKWLGHVERKDDVDCVKLRV